MEDEVKVLLIEDDEAAAEMYRTRLVADGYTVIHASDGEAGLELAVRELPDLIYLDLRLPKMDGFEVLEKVRADSRTAGVPVIILTNYDESQLRKRGLQMGALEFLVKSDTAPAHLSATTERWTSHPAEPSVPA